MSILQIVIPHRNRYPLITDTIKSIKLQSCNSWECVIVDDHSEMDQYLALRDYIGTDPKIKIIRNKARSGAAHSRNVGAALCDSEYVMFMDSDDVMAPWLVEDRMDMVAQHSDCDAHLFSSLVFQYTLFDRRTLWNVDTCEDDLIRMLRADNIAHTSSVVWNRGYFRNLGGWDEDAPSWQDWEILTRALIKGARLKRHKIIADTYIRRDASERISDQEDSDHMIASRLVLYGKIYDLLMSGLFNRSYFRELEKLYVREYLLIIQDEARSRMLAEVFKEHAVVRLSHRLRVCLYVQKIATKYVFTKISKNSRIMRYRIPCVNKRIPRNTFICMKISTAEIYCHLKKWRKYKCDNGLERLLHGSEIVAFDA